MNGELTKKNRTLMFTGIRNISGDDHIKMYQY